MMKLVTCLIFSLALAYSCGKKNDDAKDEATSWGSSLPGKISTGAN